MTEAIWENCAKVNTCLAMVTMVFYNTSPMLITTWLSIALGVLALAWLLYQILDRRNIRVRILPSLETLYIDITTLLTTHNISFFLDYGTLLGHYRNQCIPPHEFDIDISIHAQDKEQLLRALQDLPDDYYIRTPPKGDFSQWKHTNVKIKHKHRSGSLDIYLYYPFEENTLCQGKACHFYEEQVVSCVPTSDYSQLSQQWIFPLQPSTIIVAGTEYPCHIPHNAADYITHLYGTDLTPDMVGLLGNRLFIKRFWKTTP